MDARCERILENLVTANADRDARLRSPLQSYDLRDNEQYVAILALEAVVADSAPQGEDGGAEKADPSVRKAADERFLVAMSETYNDLLAKFRDEAEAVADAPPDEEAAGEAEAPAKE